MHINSSEEDAVHLSRVRETAWKVHNLQKGKCLSFCEEADAMGVRRVCLIHAHQPDNLKENVGLR